MSARSFAIFTLALASIMGAPEAVARSRGASESNRCQRQAFTRFIAAHLDERESYLNITTPLRGSAIADSVGFQGAQIPVFRRLGEGTYGVAYLGTHDGKIAVVKKSKAAAPIEAYRREIALTRFLKKKGFEVSEIVATSETDQVIIKDYAKGSYLEDLERQVRSGKLSPARMKEARSRLSDIKHRLQLVASSREFKSWCANHDFAEWLDVDDSNFLYVEGRWLLIDP